MNRILRLIACTVFALSSRGAEPSAPSQESPFQYREARLPNYLSGHRWGAEGSPLTQMQLPVAPAESMQHMVVPEGFEVQLFAAEPDIRPPLAMAWDERGRLWLCESIDYPNEPQEPGKGRDTIRICEDTDGDGLADRFTVFADQLSIPTSLAFSQGGVIVHQAPDTLFLKDTDGDDRADVRQVLFTGWSLSDTHAGPSNLRYGLDNHFWGLVGYSGFEGEIAGTPRTFRSGFYRFRPDASAFEFIRSNNNNNWGLGFSEEGLVFGSTANRNPSVFMAIPNRYYEQVRGWSGGTLTGIAETFLFQPISDRVRQVDHHGGYTAAAGHALYTARSYPREYWNRKAFVTGPTGKLIGTFSLNRDGGSFRASNESNLLASVDEWTAPIAAEVGPDGQVWFIDWYNYIVQHNPTPVGHQRGKGNAYVTALRDKRHGRIYRIEFQGGRSTRLNSLAGASPDRLVRTLTDDNMFWRSHAQRLLVERGNGDVVGALIDLIDDQNVDALELNPGAIHALWTLEGLGLLADPEVGVYDSVVGALSHPSAGVRRNAVMVLPRGGASSAAILRAHLLDDQDAQVRIAALLALADSPADSSIAYRTAQFLMQPGNADDRYLREAATMVAARNAMNFLRNALTGVSGTPSAGLLEVVERVATHWASGTESGQLGSLLRLAGQADGSVLLALLDGLLAGGRETVRPELTAGDRRYLKQLMEGLEFAAQDAMVALAQSWGETDLFAGSLESVLRELRIRVGDSSMAPNEQVRAAARLIRLADNEDSLAHVIDQIQWQTPSDLAVGLIRELGGSDSEAVVSILSAAWKRFTPASRRAAVNVLLMRFDWTMGLLGAIGRGDIPKSELSASEWQQLIYHKNTTIQLRAGNMGIGAGDPDREAVFQRKRSALTREGDLDRGRELYTLLCAQCHKLGTEGGAVGPELTGVGSRAPEEILIEIVDPNRSLETNYRAWSLETKDGRNLSGRLDSEDQSSVELLDVSGQRHVVPRNQIAVLEAGDLSLMPVGLIDDLSDADVASLVRFLSASKETGHP